MIYLFTGDGKGKTSAALGVVGRFLCLRRRVLWVSWYKSRDWQTSEMGLESQYPDLLKMVWAGRGFYFPPSPTLRQDFGVASAASEGHGKNSKSVNGALVHDFDTPEGHQKAAEDAMGIIEDTCGEYDLVVLDEVVNAIGDGLISEARVISFMKNNKSHLILTGRGASQELIDECDLVSEVKKIKHPFDKGGLAVRGLDF